MAQAVLHVVKNRDAAFGESRVEQAFPNGRRLPLSDENGIVAAGCGLPAQFKVELVFAFSSSTSPGVMTMRPPAGNPASVSSATAAPCGLEL